MSQGLRPEIFSKSRNTVIASLIMNFMTPVVLYILVKYLGLSDFVALAIADTIPVIRTVLLKALRRKTDWLGLISCIFFTLSLAFSALMGGNTLPMKLYHPIITGTIGFILCGSVLVQRPLLLILFRAVKHSKANPIVSKDIRRKVNIATAFVGFLLLADAAIHVVMALTLTTGTFFLSSRVVTLCAIVLLIGARWWFRRRK